MILPWRPVTIAGVEVLTSVTPAETVRLQELATDALVLEVGSAYGYSTIAMAQVARRVIAVDPHAGELEDSLRVMGRNLEAAGVWEKVMVCVGYSQVLLPEMEANGSVFDLVFVDGDHRKPAVASDLHYAWLMLRSGGWLAVHDYGEDRCPDVRETALAMFTVSPHPDRRTIVGDMLHDTLWTAQKP